MAHDNEAVKRYSLMQYRDEAEMQEYSEGEYIRYADHLAVVERLRASAPKVDEAKLKSAKESSYVEFYDGTAVLDGDFSTEEVGAIYAEMVRRAQPPAGGGA